MTRKYKKKSITIEAFRYAIDPFPDWFIDKLNSNEVTNYSHSHGNYCLIETLEGTMRGNVGDYIIKGIKNEIYPCKSDIFEASYEMANGDEASLIEPLDTFPVYGLQVGEKKINICSDSPIWEHREKINELISAVNKLIEEKNHDLL